jgi:anti-sigma factor RsiW
MNDVIHDLTPAYALDALDVEEAARYESHLALCAKCRTELEGMWTVAAALAHGAGGPPPPAELRERILEQARSKRRNLVSFPQRFAPRAAGSLTAVAAAATLTLGIWASSLHRELNEARRVATANAEAVAALSDPTARGIPLTGANGRMVISSTGKAALVLSGIPPAPHGKTYEIWIMADGAPQPAGLFQSASTRSVIPIAQPVPSGAVVAATVEDEGGADVPQGSRLFTSGST